MTKNMSVMTDDELSMIAGGFTYTCSMGVNPETGNTCVHLQRRSEDGKSFTGQMWMSPERFNTYQKDHSKDIFLDASNKPFSVA